MRRKKRFLTLPQIKRLRKEARLRQQSQTLSKFKMFFEDMKNKTRGSK